MSLGKDTEKWTDIKNVKDPAEYTMSLGKAFLEWTDERRSNSDDEDIIVALNYMKLMEYYKLFRQSIRSGDAVTIEWLYKEFLPIYLITGKFNYYEIDLGMIETFYHTLSPRILHMVRINRCTPLHDGVDRFGQPMAYWAQDDLLEHIQPEYHLMPFSHSQHLVVKKRCLKFNQDQFTRFRSKKRKYAEVEESGPYYDPAKIRKPTSVPKRLPERNAVSEYISKVGICHEVPGRIYNRQKMWKTLDKMDDDLGSDKKKRMPLQRRWK